MRRSALLLALLASRGGSLLAAEVVISEVYYNPHAAHGRDAEFVELHNPGTTAIDIGGWKLKEGIEATLPAGTVLAPGEYLVLAKSAVFVKEAFPRPQPPRVVVEYDDALSNSSERVTLVDAHNTAVDFILYDDGVPWPEDADGDGFSLQRLCATAPGWLQWNWVAGPPTPGQPNVPSQCPLLTPPASLVVINEIHYHPLVVGTHPATTDGEEEEFIELFNPGAAPVDIAGWRLTDGVTVTFPAGSIVEPGGFLIVGRSSERLRQLSGSQNVVPADFEGRLSNSGERVTLSTGGGDVVDSVAYLQDGDWPYGADGLGRSLERISPSSPSDDPANWQVSRILTGTFQPLEGEGPPGQGIGQKILVSLDGPGEVLVDNIKVEHITDPLNVETLVDERFEAGIEGWIAAGTAVASAHAPGEGVGGSGALRLVTTGPCPNGECGSGNSVSRSVQIPNRAGKYRVRVEIKPINGSPLFRCGFSRGAAASVSQILTPGRPNTVSAAAPPPFLTQVRRFPVQPRSTDTPTITAVVRSKSVATLTLTFDTGRPGARGSLPMLDDGAHGDHLAGDGVYGAQLPSFPHNTQVRFRIRAESAEGVGEHPRFVNKGLPLDEEVDGYYVNDLQPESDLPLYHILFDDITGAEPATINDYLGNCSVTRVAHFAFKGDLYSHVGVRYRGNTACYVLKRNFKLTFNRGRPFQGLRKMNLNSEWTDKSLVREHLAWEFVREVGTPYSETRFSRVHVNGEYMGLYLYVEHPDGRFLERNGLDSNGNLYKAKQPTNFDEPIIGVSKRNSITEYMQSWEAETNEEGDFTDLAAFIDAMHSDANRGGGPSTSFWESRSIQEHLIGYQVGQVVLNNIDSFAKNHFLYHDLATDRWSFLTWDLDLTFGKFFTLQAVGPGREVGTLNDFLLSDAEVQGDLNPWFAATVLANPLLNYIVDFFYRAGGSFYQRAYLARLWDALQEKYTNSRYDPILDGLGVILAEEAAADFAKWGRYPTNKPGFPSDMSSNLGIIKQQISLHRTFLMEYIRAFHPQVPAHPRVKITELMYAPEGADDDLELIELQNIHGAEVDISGWQITGIGRDQDFQFPAGTRIPADAVFVVARSPTAFRARYPDQSRLTVFGPYAGKLSDDGEEIRLLDAGPGFRATVDRVRYDSERGWPRARPGHSIELTAAGPERDNDVPEHWVESIALGGTPGSTAPVFLRGDTDSDAAVGLTDVIYLLNYLFRGGTAPQCIESGDVNDDTRVELTDAVFLLQHLFQGGSAPPAPYPDRGSDPTADLLGC